MSRFLFLAVLAAAAAVLLFLEAGRDPALSEVPGRADAEGASVAGASPIDAPDRQRDAIPAAPAADLPGTAAVAREPEPAADPSRGVTLELVTAVIGVPCPGAEVFILDAHGLDHEAYRTELASGGDRRRLMARLGRFFRADEDGIAVVPAPAGDLELRAVHGQEVAHLTLEQPYPGQRCRIELAPDASLRVRVVDDSGAPASGIPVELRAWNEDWNHGLVVRLTDADGLAELPEIRSAMREDDQVSDRYSVSLDLPLAEPVGYDLDLAALPTEPIELVLPPTGSVVVLLRGVDGEPVPGPVHVNLDVDRFPEHAVSIAGWNRRIAGRNLYGANARAQGGEARFSHVGLGLDLMAHAAVLGTQDMDIVKARGPERAGEEVVIEIRPDARKRVITGRLIGQDGRPVRGHRLIGAWLSSERLMDYWTDEGAFTDAAGVFRIALKADLQYPAALMLQIPPIVRGATPLEARVELPAEPPAGVTELGDLALSPAPVLAEGTIRFGDGRGAAGAELALHVEMKFYGSKMWTELPERRARADAEGRFRLHGALPGHELAQLKIEHEDAPVTLREFRPGETGMEILLEPAGVLAGSFLLDPSLDPGSLRLSLRWQEEEGQQRGTGARLQQDGSWRAEGLPVGRVQLQLQLGMSMTYSGGEETVLWSQEAMVPPGPARPDPVLQAVDLRRFRFHRVRLRGEGDEPTRYASLWKSDIEPPVTVLRADTEGVVLVPSWYEVDSWTARCRGFLDEELGAVVGDRVVELRAAIPVLFRLEGASIPEGATLRLAAFGLEESFGGFSPSWLFAPDGTATLYFQRAGAYELSCSLHLDGKRGPATLGADSGVSPQRIEIHEGRLGQEQILTVPQAAVDAALAQLQADG